MTRIYTLIALGFFLIPGCSVQRLPTKSDAIAKTFCPSNTLERVTLRQDQRHRWCETPEGVVHGPFQASYADGKSKVECRVTDGVLDGPYRAWHASGRWAVKATFSQGTKQGVTAIRPPYGPPSQCQQGECSSMDSILARPFCLPEEISAVFNGNKRKLTACLPASTDREPMEFIAEWRIELTGTPGIIQIRTDAEVNTDTIDCLRREIKAFRFPAPLGQACTVRMAFQLAY